MADDPSRTRPSAPGSLPKIDFATFVVSLSTSALVHMGRVPDPQTGQPADKNLGAARETIDLLELLQAKTAGNLDAEEARLLQSLLYELRMQFVEAGR
jgi:hypothetical protein